MDEHLAPDFGACALLSIDLQEDFADHGALGVPGTLAAAAVLAPLLEAFRKAGRLIVHVVRFYPPGGGDVDLVRRGRVLAGEELAAPGRPGAEMLPGLLPAGARLDPEPLLGGRPQVFSESELALYKPRWGAFHRTPLEDILQERGVSTVCIAGTSFANCVRATVYEASSRDFRVAVVRDAVAGLDVRGEAWLRGLGCLCVDSSDIIEKIL